MDIYQHMIHQTSKKVSYLGIQNKQWNLNMLCRRVSKSDTHHFYQSIDLKDTLGHNVQCLSNSSQYGKYHIFAKRNICYRHVHSVYIHC